MTEEDNGDKPITVEAEYSHKDESHCQQWTFETLSPGQARDRVITKYVPLEATLFRYAVWYGRRDDRPTDDNENEFISLDKIEETTDW